MRTLENFFKNGLTNNLTNRVFKLFHGTLYDEKPCSKATSPSFYDLAMASQINGDIVRRSVLSHRSNPFVGKSLITGGALHQLPEEGKGMFDKPSIEPSPNQPSPHAARRVSQLAGRRQVVICMEETPEEMHERVERLAGLTSQALGHRTWTTANMVINETSARKWLYEGGSGMALESRCQEDIWKLVQTHTDFQVFVEDCLKPLHQIRQSDMENLPNIKSMDVATFGRYVRGLRPYREATTSIIAAMRMVKGYMPEATYVWFDGDLRWHYLDNKLEPLKWEQDGRMNVQLLEDAVLEAADRGILNQPLKPDLAWFQPTT